jgi:thymidylate kinase
MYICIEGVKCSGKTTLVEGLTTYLTNKGQHFQTANPTRPMPIFSIAEKMSHTFGFLRTIDKWNEYLYALRSNYVGKHTDWECDLIIGDRSIITSYVTRWYKWENPQICINRVNEKESQIHSPDYVIYLQISLETVQERLKQRKNRYYGKFDETPFRLKQALNAYQEIQQYPIDRLAKTKWLYINAEQSAEKVLSDCIEIVDNLIKSNT